VWMLPLGNVFDRAKREEICVLLAREILSARCTTMWLAIAIILILLWVGGFLLFHIAAFALHILLIIAAVALVIHLVGGGRRAV
jgi:hypothetical protein